MRESIPKCHDEDMVPELRYKNSPGGVIKRRFSCGLCNRKVTRSWQGQ